MANTSHTVLLEMYDMVIRLGYLSHPVFGPSANFDEITTWFGIMQGIHVFNSRVVDDPLKFAACIVFDTCIELQEEFHYSGVHHVLARAGGFDSVNLFYNYYFKGCPFRNKDVLEHCLQLFEKVKDYCEDDAQVLEMVKRVCSVGNTGLHIVGELCKCIFIFPESEETPLLERLFPGFKEDFKAPLFQYFYTYHRRLERVRNASPDENTTDEMRSARRWVRSMPRKMEKYGIILTV